MKRLGVVGGGQLGRMMALAAAPLGIRTVVLDPGEDACARHYAQHIRGAFDDLGTMQQLAESVDVATFEFENVPAESVAHLSRSVPAWPPAGALAVARDRWSEKTLFREQSIPLPPLARVDSQADLDLATSTTVGLPAVLKTRTLGYDGKGQKVLRTESDVAGAWSELGSVPCVLEGFVEFDDELSCIGVRTELGDTRFYELVKNEHRDGILYKSVPQANHPLQARAEDYTAKVMAALDYVGVMAFEFFRCGDELVANEIAPRVHNSGHWTIEGARVSQFENHVRAVCGLPLGATETRGPVAMLNVYGDRPDVLALLELPGVAWHDYDKTPRPGRKIGHVTVQAEDEATLLARLERAEACLNNVR